MNKSDILKEERSQEWRVELRSTLKNKERTQLTRVKMNEVDPALRIQSNVEVNSGLTAEQAQAEAKRCIDCANPTCITGCPVEINIPTFVKYIEKGQFINAAKTLKQTSTLPAVCGRVCPQEKQCEANCFYTQKLKKDPVAIGYLERFAADYEQNSGEMNVPDLKPNKGIKVAIIGSGPAGLACAGEMAKNGYDVTVFEALHEIGGVLKYGIPEFRLPNKVVDIEINVLKEMGVKFETNVIVGKTVSFQALEEEGFKAFFAGSGAGLPRFMNIPGENYIGILSANEYLTRINLMGAASSENDTPVLSGKNVVVIGGGNTAMDSVRTAKRLGAERAMIVYRRGMDEMPARAEEIHHAQEEGVEFITLSNPVEYFADADGRVNKIKIQKMELAEPDKSGRRRPVPIEGSEYCIDVNTVVVSVGVSPNPLVPNANSDLETSSWGTLEVDADSLQTTVPYIFAGGDIVRGGATVILAMGDGRRAAKAMDKYLTEEMT